MEIQIKFNDNFSTDQVHFIYVSVDNFLLVVAGVFLFNYFIKTYNPSNSVRLCFRLTWFGLTTFTETITETATDYFQETATASSSGLSSLCLIGPIV